MARASAGRSRRAAAFGDRAGEQPAVELPVFALWVLAATLAGFVLSSAVGIAPVWVAAAGALVLAGARPAAATELVLAAEPTLLVFVLGLGDRRRSRRRARAVERGHARCFPAAASCRRCSGSPPISAVAANLVNNLPATLIILPVVARPSGPGAVLAMLVGVNVGPNLDVCRLAGDAAVAADRPCPRARRPTSREFTRLGVRTVPVDAGGLDARVVVGSAGPVMRAVDLDRGEHLGGVRRPRSRAGARRRRAHAAARGAERRRGARHAWRGATAGPPPAAAAGTAAASDRRRGGRGAARGRARASRPARRGARLTTRAGGARGARRVRRRRSARGGPRRRGARRPARASVRARASSSTTRPARCWSCGR